MAMGYLYRALRVSDRCDRCGVQAYVLVKLTTGVPLLFCGHHYTKHEAVLKTTAIAIRDERDRLTVKETESH